MKYSCKKRFIKIIELIAEIIITIVGGCTLAYLVILIASTISSSEQISTDSTIQIEADVVYLTTKEIAYISSTSTPSSTAINTISTGVSTVQTTVEQSTETTTVDPTPYLDIPLSKELQKYTYNLSQEYGIDYFLIIAVIEQESSFRPTVVNCGNYGLMQINRVNHSWLSEALNINDFLNPYQNIKAGTYMLGSLYKKYGFFSTVLMAYNLGEGGASRYWRQGIYSTAYSDSVLAKRNKYLAMIESKI